MSVGSAEQQTTNKHSLSKSNKHIGYVKWFNNKSGYGFITLMDDDTEFKGRDIFSHHSSIKANGDLYKYLVQGEYVEFDVQKMDSNNEHEHQAVNITGIMNGDLMCETRFKNKDLSRVRDGFAPPRSVRTNDRGERTGGERSRGRPHNRVHEEHTSEN
jgi:cold shock CspA family protein